MYFKFSEILKVTDRFEIKYYATSSAYTVHWEFFGGKYFLTGDSIDELIDEIYEKTKL